jgi:hypothetical protein
MLVELTSDQYDWICENAPFDLSVLPPVVSATAQSPVIFCSICLRPTTGPHATCSGIHPHVVASCTCGDDHDRSFLHRYDGAPCRSLHRVDL